MRHTDYELKELTYFHTSSDGLPQRTVVALNALVDAVVDLRQAHDLLLKYLRKVYSLDHPYG